MIFAAALLLIVPAQVDASNAAGGQQFREVHDGAARSDGLRVLNGYLQPILPSAKALQCDALIAAKLGVDEAVYVGTCTAGGRSAMLICADTGVGEFAVTDWRGASDRTAMIAFAVKNCPGG